VGSVEQPQLSGLERPHVRDERRSRRLPQGAPRREVSRQHPLRERLGGHRLGVVDAGLPRDLGSVIIGRPGCDAVDHRRDEGDVGVDPRRERGIHERCEVTDHASDHGPVVGHVVVGHDGHRSCIRCAPDEQAGNELARSCRDDAGQRIGLQRSDVHLDVVGRHVQPAGSGAAVARLGHGNRDDGDPLVGEVPAQGVEVVRGMHGAQAGDDLGAGTARPTDQERVEAVLSTQALGDGG
jgi:hypothetical protein